MGDLPLIICQLWDLMTGSQFLNYNLSKKHLLVKVKSEQVYNNPSDVEKPL